MTTPYVSPGRNPDPGQEDSPNVTIVVGEIAFTDENALFQSTDDSAQYTDYYIANKYEGDLHRYMMGVTSPGGFRGASVAVCQLANSTLLWISEWTACRFKTKPEIPNPESLDSNWVLLDIMPETVQEVVGPDGVTPLWRISGIYVYGNTNPAANIFTNVVFPRPPWLKDNYPRVFPLSQLQQGLIDTSTGGGKPISPAIPITPPSPPTNPAP